MIYQNIKSSAVNSVIVKVDEALATTYRHGSLEVFIDPLFNPTHHARIYGIVEAVPQGKCFNEEGIEIEKTVQVGDKVYFHYLTTSDEGNCLFGNSYRVPYYWIFCIVRGNDILPVGGWTLCSQIIEDGQDFETVDVGGRQIQAVLSESGLVTSIKKKTSVKFAKLAYIGSPLPDQKVVEASVGDTVILAKNANFINQIEGENYFTVRQEDLLGTRVFE